MVIFHSDVNVYQGSHEISHFPPGHQDRALTAPVKDAKVAQRSLACAAPGGKSHVLQAFGKTMGKPWENNRKMVV